MTLLAIGGMRPDPIRSPRAEILHMLARTASCTLVSATLLASLFAGGGCQSASRSAGAGSSGSSFAVSAMSTEQASFANAHQFYYYPSTQVYRDCDEDRWLWSEDGGATFQAARRLPAGVSVGDEIPFAVFLALDAPAMEHQRIAAAYPAETAGTVTVQGASDYPY